MEFMSLWDTQVKDGVVSFDEFCDYYRDVSASVDTDEEFCTIIDGAWKLNEWTIVGKVSDKFVKS